LSGAESRCRRMNGGKDGIFDGERRPGGTVVEL